MADFTINIDLSELTDIASNIKEKLEEQIEDIAKEAAEKTTEHLKTLAETNLHGSKEVFKESVKMAKEEDGQYVISAGVEPYDMLPGLLASPKHKVSKDGNIYTIIPFKHNKDGEQNAKAASLSESVKDKMRSKKIPFKKIERDSKGKPKTGLLHKFNAPSDPKLAKESDSVPLLQDVRVYQTKLKEKGRIKKDKQGNQMATKSIFTFRTASSSQIGSGKWQHPGIEHPSIMEQARQWAIEEVDRIIKERIDDIIETK